VRLCPPIARLRQQLLASGARAVGMSGSGATLFGIFPDRAAAERAAARWTPPAPAWRRVASIRESG
jgi:4-diphosphocytidyl-2-C-methyl-D-erythritol kinase